MTGVEVLEQNLPSVIIILGLFCFVLGIFYARTKKGFLFGIELLIIFTLAFFIYDGKTNFNTVMLLGFVSLLSFGVGLGLIYIYKKHIKKEETKKN